MSYGTPFHSLVLLLRRVFLSVHAWQYDDATSRRTCTICSRHEELEVDVVSSNWVVLRDGNQDAHPR